MPATLALTVDHVGKILRDELPQLPLHAHIHEQLHEAGARVVAELGEPCDMVRPDPISSHKQLSLEKWWDDPPGSSPFSTFARS
jgi:hypothetical protein